MMCLHGRESSAAEEADRRANQPLRIDARLLDGGSVQEGSPPTTNGGCLDRYAGRPPRCPLSVSRLLASVYSTQLEVGQQ